MKEPNSPTLRLTADEMRRIGYRIIDEIVDHFDTVADKPAMKLSSRADLEARLSEPLPLHPTDFDSLLERLRTDVWSNIGNLNHPRFFAFIPSPSNFISVMADALASGFNPFAGTWLEGSGPAQIELVTIDWLRQICRLPESAGGLFVSGGSVANLTGLIAARHIRLHDRIENAVVYFSDQTHSSIERALRVIGFLPDQFRKLPADSDFKLDPVSLSAGIAIDRAAGLRPFCVIANAGTTNTGAVDPFNQIADICTREEMWMHIDGAYGAAAALSERGRHQLAGIERADSISLDPHKWLFQPYEIGCVLLRDFKHLKQTFHILPEYLKDVQRTDEEINFCDYGIQLTRGFRALKLWMSIKLFGAEAFRSAIEEGITLAEEAERILREESDWEVLSPANLAIVAFRFVPRGASEADINLVNQRIVQATMTAGFAVVTSTSLGGRVALRLCTINPSTTIDDVRSTLNHLAEFGHSIFLEMNHHE